MDHEEKIVNAAKILLMCKRMFRKIANTLDERIRNKIASSFQCVSHVSSSYIQERSKDLILTFLEATSLRHNFVNKTARMFDSIGKCQLSLFYII